MEIINHWIKLKTSIKIKGEISIPNRLGTMLRMGESNGQRNRATGCIKGADCRSKRLKQKYKIAASVMIEKTTLIIVTNTLLI